MRFSNGVPQAMWFSQHSGGQAFTYNCLEKNGVRVRQVYSSKLIASIANLPVQARDVRRERYARKLCNRWVSSLLTFLP